MHAIVDALLLGTCLVALVLVNVHLRRHGVVALDGLKKAWSRMQIADAWMWTYRAWTLAKSVWYSVGPLLAADGSGLSLRIGGTRRAASSERKHVAELSH